jgi:hypothetical protein
MSSQPTAGPPPPVASKPPSLIVKRAGLKRTFSVGAAPKKSQVISSPKGYGLNGSPAKIGSGNPFGASGAAPNGGPFGAAPSVSPSTSGGSSASASTNQSVASSNFASGSASTPNTQTQVGQQNSSALAPRPPGKRPPSGSFAGNTMYSSSGSSSNQGTTSPSPSNGGASPSPNRSTPGRLSSAAYANFAGEATSSQAPLSPRGGDSPSPISPRGIRGESDPSDASRPRRPAAPPRPATLRATLSRASVSTPGLSEHMGSLSAEGVLSGASPNPSLSPVKTGAQMRPPVPKKNFSTSVGSADTGTRSLSATPQSASPMPEPIARHPSPTASPLHSSDGTYQSQEGPAILSPEDDSDGRIGTQPTLNRTKTPRVLGQHFKSPSAALSHSLVPYVSLIINS